MGGRCYAAPCLGRSTYAGRVESGRTALRLPGDGEVLEELGEEDRGLLVVEGGVGGDVVEDGECLVVVVCVGGDCGGEDGLSAVGYGEEVLGGDVGFGVGLGFGVDGGAADGGAGLGVDAVDVEVGFGEAGGCGEVVGCGFELVEACGGEVGVGDGDHGDDGVVVVGGGDGPGEGDEGVLFGGVAGEVDEGGFDLVFLGDADLVVVLEEVVDCWAGVGAVEG